MQKGNSFLYWIKVVFLGIVLGLGLQFAQAWTAPTLAPPNGNVGGPVTLGAGAQYKTGKLGVNSAITPTSALEVGGGGNVLVGGKAYSAATVDTDLASTLATKGYVDGKVGGGSGLSALYAPLNGKEISCQVRTSNSWIIGTTYAKVEGGKPYTRIKIDSGESYYRRDTNWISGLSTNIALGSISISAQWNIASSPNLNGAGSFGEPFQNATDNCTASFPW